MEEQKQKGLQNVVGWILTIVLSVMGAWYTIDARVYTVEKKIELVQMQVDNMSKSIEKQEKDMDEVKDMFNRIDKNIVQIQEIMNTKQDKYK